MEEIEIQKYKAKISTKNNGGKERNIEIKL